VFGIEPDTTVAGVVLTDTSLMDISRDVFDKISISPIGIAVVVVDVVVLLVEVVVDEVDDVVVVELVEDVVVVVVTITKSVKLSHIELSQCNLMIVAPSGTTTDVYPASRVAFATLFSKGVIYPSTSEYKSNGPVSLPPAVKVINIVCAILFYF
jgi:hypothetical protein